MKLTGAQALVRCLEAERTAFAFGIAGGKLGPLLHALAQTPSIRYVGLRHEAAGPMMAAAAFARTGTMAVALGEMGPGGLNLASGMGVAFNNNLAVLAVTTNQHRVASYPHVGMFMDLDSRALFAPSRSGTPSSPIPSDTGAGAHGISRGALRPPGAGASRHPARRLGGRGRHADLEFDVEPSRTAPSMVHVRTGMVLPTVRLARRGASAGDRRRWRCRSLRRRGGVRELAALLGAPVVPTQMALGVIATDSPFFVGHGGLIGGPAVLAAIEQADVVLSVGCRYSSWMWDEIGALVRGTHRHDQCQHRSVVARGARAPRCRPSGRRP